MADALGCACSGAEDPGGEVGAAAGATNERSAVVEPLRAAPSPLGAGVGARRRRLAARGGASSDSEAGLVGQTSGDASGDTGGRARGGTGGDTGGDASGDTGGRAGWS
ncbi:MAG: hypothetical protein IPK80_20210 [Nannocystis sp.]|nr:hypothetical protein [Nannocystis sp.]